MIDDNEPELVVTIDILLSRDHLHHCSTGVYAFCRRHGINIRDFRVGKGVPLSVMRATGEAYAIEACEYVEKLHGR